MESSSILVTGCGGDIGLGIGKILKSSSIFGKVVGCDIHADHPGSKVFDDFRIVPKAGSNRYLCSLREIIAKHSVNFIIPTSEPELRYLLKLKKNRVLEGVPFIIANEKALKIGFDKLLTAKFLRSINLPYPWTRIVKEGEPVNLPCIIKSRQGSGSRGVCVVTEELVDYYSKSRPDDIWQEYLAPDDQEYTCGVYRSKLREIRTIIIKRRLQGGLTGFGEVIYNPEIETQLMKLGDSLDLSGSINVQLRVTRKGPTIFEINPRFSSTVVFRHLLGFKDLVWSLQEAAGEKLESYKTPQKGMKFYRGSQEYILEKT